MRILLISQYYYPESFRINDVGEELVKKGHHVEALVGIPNYPTGIYFDGYGVFKKRVEIINGVIVHRVFQIPRGKKSSKILLSLNYLSYALNACLWVLFYYSLKKKYDATFVFQVSPVTQAIPAVLLKKLRGTPLFLWVQDVWPDSVLTTLNENNEKRNNFITNILTKLTEHVYRNSYKILYSSSGMKTLINRNNDYSGKEIYLPNWCDDMLKMPLEGNLHFPGDFKIMMAGNLGQGLGVDVVVGLIKSLSDIESLHFIIVGGGSIENYLKSRFKELGLNNVTMTGRLPFSQMPYLYEQADAMLLTLKPTEVLSLKSTVPSRLQSYMSAGKPILGMIDGCAKEVIEAADCGYCVNAGDVNAMSQYIKNYLMSHQSEFKEKGKNSRKYFERYYLKSGCIANLEYYLRDDYTKPLPFNIPSV